MSKQTKNQNEAAGAATQRANSTDQTKKEAVGVNDSSIPQNDSQSAPSSPSNTDERMNSESSTPNRPESTNSKSDAEETQGGPEATQDDTGETADNESHTDNEESHFDDLVVNDGKLRIAPLEDSYKEIFEKEFGIAPDLLLGAGIDLVNFDLNSDSWHESNGIWEDGDTRVFHGPGFNRDFQWNLGHIIDNLPALPFGESLRAPIFSKTGEIVDYRYHRLASNGEDYIVQTYEPGHWAPLVSFLPENQGLLNDPTVPLVLVDDVFQALQAHRKGHAVINLNGLLHQGFRSASSDSGRKAEALRKWNWSESETREFIEQLHLGEIPLSTLNDSPVLAGNGTLARTVVIFCDSGWLEHTKFEKTVRLTQQIKALFEFLQEKGAQPYLVTCSADGSDRLAHALNGDEWDFAHLGYMQYSGFKVSH